MSSVNHNNITGEPVKDARNSLHGTGVMHHRLVKRGAEMAVHKQAVHPINKYGNTKDQVSDVEGSAASTSFRMKNWGYLLIAGFVIVLVISNSMGSSSGGGGSPFYLESVRRSGTTYH